MCQPKIDLNSFVITVLTSGDIKVETGTFAGTMHLTADAFVGFMANAMGGTIDTKVRDHSQHSHDHDHNHEHSHN